MAISTSSTQTVVSKYDAPYSKESESPEETAHSGLKTGSPNMDLRHRVVLESNEMLKVQWDHIKRTKGLV